MLKMRNYNLKNKWISFSFQSSLIIRKMMHKWEITSAKDHGCFLFILFIYAIYLSSKSKYFLEFLPKLDQTAVMSGDQSFWAISARWNPAIKDKDYNCDGPSMGGRRCHRNCSCFWDQICKRRPCKRFNKKHTHVGWIKQTNTTSKKNLNCIHFLVIIATYKGYNYFTSWHFSYFEGVPQGGSIYTMSLFVCNAWIANF